MRALQECALKAGVLLSVDEARSLGLQLPQELQQLVSPPAVEAGLAESKSEATPAGETAPISDAGRDAAAAPPPPSAQTEPVRYACMLASLEEEIKQARAAAALHAGRKQALAGSVLLREQTWQAQAAEPPVEADRPARARGRSVREVLRVLAEWERVNYDFFVERGVEAGVQAEPVTQEQSVQAGECTDHEYTIPPATQFVAGCDARRQSLAVVSLPDGTWYEGDVLVLRDQEWTTAPAAAPAAAKALVARGPAPASRTGAAADPTSPREATPSSPLRYDPELGMVRKVAPLLADRGPTTLGWDAHKPFPRVAALPQERVLVFHVARRYVVSGAEAGGGGEMREDEAMRLLPRERAPAGAEVEGGTRAGATRVVAVRAQELPEQEMKALGRAIKQQQRRQSKAGSRVAGSRVSDGHPPGTRAPGTLLLQPPQLRLLAARESGVTPHGFGVARDRVGCSYAGSWVEGRKAGVGVQHNTGASRLALRGCSAA